MSMGNDENFKEYAQRWRDLTGRFHPPLPSRELIDMFMGTLIGPFFNHLIGSSSAIFTELDEPAYYCELDTEGVEEKPWVREVKRYLETRDYHEGASVNDKEFLRRFFAKFFLNNGILYKHNHNLVLLRCVDK